MRVGVIGTGWGRMHVGAFRRAGADVVALCGHSMTKTEAIARAEGIPSATTDVRALCESVDLVVVASPDALHAEHVRLALEHGRHVLCEKPLATSAAEAAALVAVAAASGVQSAVSFPYRMLAGFPALRGFSPRLRGLEVVVRNAFLAAGTERSADFGGASHVVDAALWLLDAPLEEALVERDGAAVRLFLKTAHATATLVHRPSAEPGLWGSWALWGDGFEAGISAGYRPALGGWRVEAPRAFEDGAWRDLAPAAAPSPDALEPWALAHVATARAFLRLIQTGGRGSLASFDEGAAVHRALEGGSRGEK